jgi:hypothetical protein
MPKNTFSLITNPHNRFSRRWGTKVNVVEPYITGYHFVKWTYLPDMLVKNVDHVKQPTDGLGKIDAIQDVFNSTTIAVTIPGATMNRAQFNGLGNIKWSAPTNAEWDDTVTIKFIEMSGLPIFHCIHGWFRMIRDYRAGVSTIDGNPGDYNKKNYAGTMYYWTTEPNGLHVDYHCCITGMYPLKDPTDSFGHDLSANDKLELDIDFSMDYLWHENWTFDNCKWFAETYHRHWKTAGGRGSNAPPDPNGTAGGGRGQGQRNGFGNGVITGYGLEGPGSY